jgi:hypothetical protein
MVKRNKCSTIHYDSPLGGQIELIDKQFSVHFVWNLMANILLRRVDCLGIKPSLLSNFDAEF